MLKEIRYISNSFSLSFERFYDIRRKSYEFEDFLKAEFPDHYGQPQVISIPDELDPDVPRIIFGSKHGFSQIVISQLNMSLNVFYSPDWQKDISKGEKYIKDRVKVLYKLLELLNNPKIFFCGLITKANMPMTNEKNILDFFDKNISKTKNEDNIYDMFLKKTFVLEEKFFSHITLSSYRKWNNIKEMTSILKLSKDKATEIGIEIIGDFNDRFSYNENENYYSPSDISEKIISNGIIQIKKSVKSFKGEK